MNFFTGGKPPVAAAASSAKEGVGGPSSKEQEVGRRLEGGKGASRKPGNKGTLAPGQMLLSVASGPVVPPSRLAGGASESGACASFQWDLQPFQASKSGPAGPASAGDKKGKSLAAGGEVLQPGKGRQLARGLKFPAVYQAITGQARIVQASHDISRHAAEEVGDQAVTANVRRGFENLGGRMGAMPLVEEEPVEPPPGPEAEQPAEAGLRNWQAPEASHRQQFARGDEGVPVGANGRGGQVGAGAQTGSSHAAQAGPPVLSAEQQRAALSCFNTPLMIIAGKAAPFQLRSFVCA